MTSGAESCRTARTTHGDGIDGDGDVGDVDGARLPDSLLGTHPEDPVTRVPHRIHDDGPPGARATNPATAGETGNRTIHTQKSRHVRKILTPH